MNYCLYSTGVEKRIVDCGATHNNLRAGNLSEMWEFATYKLNDKSNEQYMTFYWSFVNCLQQFVSVSVGKLENGFTIAAEL